MRYDAEINRAIRLLARRLYGAGRVTIEVEPVDRGSRTLYRAIVRVAESPGGALRGTRVDLYSERAGRASKSPSQARVVLARELATLLTRATIADAAVLRAIPSELRPPAKGG